MKKNEYIKHLDGIRCSTEFREKMEKQLESGICDEYEDSVSDIEHAPKINYHRWTALTASALIVIGIGGFAFFRHDDIAGESIESNIIIESSDERSTAEIIPSGNYSIDISVSDILNSEMISTGTIPSDLAERYINSMRNWSDFELDEKPPSLVSEPTGSIDISFTGDENFVWTINSNGFTVKRYAEHQEYSYYSDICYRAVLSWIARDIPYLDWSSMIDGETGKALDIVFRNYADEIEVISEADYKQNENESIKFFDSGIFYGIINYNGDFAVNYSTGSESNTVYFRSSPELYKEIYKIVLKGHYNLADIISKSDVMFYTSSTGQSAHHTSFSHINTDILAEAVRNLDWCVEEREYPAGEFFGIGNSIMIKRDGSIYDKDTGFMYIPTNQNNSEIINAVEEVIKSVDTYYVAYLVASSNSRFGTVTGEVVYSCEEYSGRGQLTYNAENKDEYVYITDDNGKSVELTVNDGQWKLTEEYNGVVSSIDGYSVMNNTAIDYERIKREILIAMNNMLSDDTVINKCTVVSDENIYSLCTAYTCGGNDTYIEANIDYSGNAVYLRLLVTDSKSGESVTDITFTFGDGYGKDIVYTEAE